MCLWCGRLKKRTNFVVAGWSPAMLNEALAWERKTQCLTPNKTFKWRHGARSPMTRYISCSQTRQSNILWTLSQNTGQHTEPHGGQVESLWGKRRSSPWNPLFHPPWVHVALRPQKRDPSSGAVWESRCPSWAVRPNEPSGFRGRKAILNHASALVSACP